MEYIEAYKSAAQALQLTQMPAICGDSNIELNKKKELLDLNGGNPFSLILIDPPYMNMMSRKKTGGDIAIYGQKSTPFTDLREDLGNMNQEEWLSTLKSCVEKTLKLLKKKGHVVIFIKDLQPDKKNVNLLHADIINKINEIPTAYYKGPKIWADRSVKLFPYGYPLGFVANQTHQYILVFRKEK